MWTTNCGRRDLQVWAVTSMGQTITIGLIDVAVFFSMLRHSGNLFSTKYDNYRLN